MIGEFVFGHLFPFFIFLIPAEFFINRNQLIRVIFIIVNLGSFKTHFINTYLGGKFFYFFNLVLVGLYYKELEKHKWCFAIKCSFPLDNILCSFNYFIDIAPNAILPVYLLCCSVNGNNKPVKATLNRFSCSIIRKVMGISRRGSIQSF